MKQQTLTPDDMRITPKDILMEQVVLGSIMESGTYCAEAIPELTEDDFDPPEHQHIFNACRTCYERDGTVDFMTVEAELRKREVLEKCGGAEYLKRLTQEYIGHTKAPTHIKVLHEFAALRKTRQIAGDLYSVAEALPDDLNSVLLDTSEKIAALLHRNQPRRSKTKREAVGADPTLLMGAIPEQGFLRDYFDWTSITTDAPEHFHLIAGLSCVSAALGRSCYIDLQNGIYPNLYAVLVAQSSRFRKSTCVNYARRMVNHLTVTAEIDGNTQEQPLTFPDEFSPEGFISTLSQRPTGLFIWSEMASVLAKFGASYMQGMAELLTHLYDCPPHYRRTLRREQIAVEDPCVSILAATTPEWLTEHISETTAVGGFLPRFLFVGADEPGELMTRPPSLDRHQEQALATKLGMIRAAYAGEEPVAISIDAIADEYDSFAQHLDSKRIGGHSEALGDAFVTRLTTTALKVAMLFEAAENPGARAISELSWARASLVTEYLRTYVGVLLRDLTFTDWERWRKKALDAIRDSGERGVSKSDLTRGALRGLQKQQRDQLLEALQEEGVVVETAGLPGGRGPAPRVFVCDE